MSTRSFFLFAAALAVALSCAAASAGDYKGPIKLVPSQDGATLYSLNMDSKDVSVINVAEAKIERT
ncbi:MAG: hypothetical protein ACI4QC_08285, partial [Thermoguttaceae bacterium]